MALNAGNISAYGYHGTELWLALASTPGLVLPTRVYDAPPGEMWSTGYLSQEGINYEKSGNPKVINALQGGDAVKRLGGAVDLTFSATMLEETDQTVGILHGGQLWTHVTHVDGNFAEMDFAENQGAVLTMAYVLDLMSDTGKKKRYLGTAAAVSADGSVSLASSDNIAQVPVSVQIIGASFAKLRTDIPGVYDMVAP